MSGTSLDGIDVAVIDLVGRKMTTVAAGTVAYPDAVRARILAVSNAECHIRDISRLNFELAELYAKAVRKVYKGPLGLVGCHGQTVYHEGSGPMPNTLQLGEAGVLAERLGVPVVSNFRPADMAAGGKGAPLVPFVDELLFARAGRVRVALNIGGIANVTVLRPGAPVVAFDTGPGNMVIDQLMERHNGRRFDRGGKVAASGKISRELLDELLGDPYFAASAPKTAGREEYGAAMVERLVATGLALPDLVATATALTAASIALGVPGDTAEVIAAGGGVHNRQLMAQLAALLPGVRLTTTAEFGIDPNAKEAIAFAILAYRTWKRRTGNLPSATGARRTVILGDLTL